MKSSGFQNTILGEATNRAVTQVAQGLEAKAASLPTAKLEISGLVADAGDPNALVINVGSRNGLRVGTVLNVKRKDHDVRDSDTNKIIRTVDATIGTLTITDVEAGSAVGRFRGPASRKPGTW